MKNKHLGLVVSITLVLALAMVSGWFFYGRGGYDTTRPKQGDITEAVYGLGRVKSNRRFDVIIGVISTVKKLYVDEGSAVLKNAPLIEFESGGVFRAPFSGTVTLVTARDNETALPHNTILRLEDLHDRFIEISLEQEAALRVKKGQTAKISFESVRGQVLEGEVTSLFSRQDEFLAQISAKGLESNVLPGMTADVTIEVGKIQNATLVPLKALNKGMLTMKKDGRWQKIKVNIGHIDGAYAEITDGTVHLDDEIRIKKGQ